MKKFLLFILLSGLLFLTGWLFYLAAVGDMEELVTTKKSREGFEWEEVKGHGLRFLAQKSDKLKMVKVENGFAVMMGNEVELVPEILVIKKLWFESPEDVIESQFVGALTEKEKEGCAVISEKVSEMDDARGLRRLRIEARTEAYQEFVDKKKRELGGFYEGCGEYGSGMGYFAYFKGNPGQILFVPESGDWELFDAETLELK